ncbi:MAG: PD-(D/E)XK nuclease family protein [Acidobacteriota bacterium]|nr:PD-(D/E)XK nuclease family protein [Acidobacteriota bacterium]
MARIFVSASGEERVSQALAWLDEESDRSELLILAPARGAADDVLRRGLPVLGPTLGRHRSTLHQLAHELASASLAESGLRSLFGLSTVALASSCVHAALRDRQLGYFVPVAEMPGLARAVARTLDELRLEGVDREALSRLGPAGKDLAEIQRRFEGALEQWELVDRRRVLEAAIAQVREHGGRLVGLPLLLLDIEPRSGLEQELLGELVERAPSCLATIPAGTGQPLERLRRVVRGEVEEAESGRDATGVTDLVRARGFLFQLEAPEQTAERDGTLELFSAPGEDRECVEITRRILARAQQGVSFDRMTILLRHPRTYMPLLEDALRRGGVPAYFTRGTRRPDTGGRAFLALLACAAEGLSATRFAEYLSLGETPPLDEKGAPPRREVPWVEPADDQLVLKTLVVEPPSDLTPEAEGPSLPTPALWERLILDAAVIGGEDRWRRRLGGLEREMELRLREVGDEEDAQRRRLERDLVRLASLRRFALPVIEHLAALPDSATWGVWIGELERLAARILREPERVLGLLAELRPMSEVGPVTLGQVQEVLRDRLSFLQDEPPSRRYGRVFVATIPEANGRSFDSVFLAGLAEGLFPAKPFEDPLLLDVDRQRLGGDLDTQEDRFREERALLRRALSAAAERLVASYPRLDQVAGRARVPSFYALDLLRAATGRMPALQSLETAAPARLGWPAPTDADTAIDEAEFDLAVLAPLLHPNATDGKGKARYLLENNEHLVRSLRTRARRWLENWTSVDGLVAPEESTLKVLRAQLPERRSYSPTALQSYAVCPYRFLLYAIHRLRPREDLASPERLDPLTRGSLFHETQFVFFERIKQAGLLPLHLDFVGDLLEALDRSLDEVSDRYAEELAPALPSVWASEIESLRTDLRGWIRRLVDDSDWVPMHAELAFGLPPDDTRDSASSPQEAVVLGGLRLRGSIDMVERNWRRQAMRVTDHKTGRAPKEKALVIKGGEILQPVLYALAAEEKLAKEGERVESGRLFYCTQRGGYREIEVQLTADSRAAVRAVVDLVEHSVLHGFFPAAPREDACRWCDYRTVCGPYEELRVARKRQEPLVALVGLRGRA